MQQKPLVDDRAPELQTVASTRAEKRECVVTVGFDHRRRLPGQDRCQMFDLEMFRKGPYKSYHQTHLLAPVECGLRIETVVAQSAVVLRIILSEIVQQHPAAAHAGFGVRHGVHKQLTAYLLLRNRLALHELFQFADVLIAVERDAFSVLPVPAGTSGLLIIALDAFRNIIVYDKAHIRLVDSHAEGYGRHNDLHVLHQEPVLVLRPGLRIQSRMIRKRADSVDLQQLGDFLNFLAAQAVYDS